MNGVATSFSIQNSIKELDNNINSYWNTVYPVGSIYLSLTEISPASLFGGTWEQIKDTFLLSAGDNYAAGSTGGEATHTLTINEMPRHNHMEHLRAEGYQDWSEYTTTGYGILFSYNKGEYGIQYHGSGKTFNSATVSADASTDFTGNGASHNNMPPYLAVYVWKRIA